MHEQSVSRWINELQDGNEDAAQKIWDAYFKRLVSVANRVMAHNRKRVNDEEDVAIQVFESFFRNAGQQRFAKLESRDDLWQILIMMTKRRSQKEYIRETAKKRGGGKVRGESVFDGGDGQAFGSHSTEEVSPDFVVDLMDMLRHACEQLDDPVLEQVAVMKLEGYENAEIAEGLDVSLRSVERKMRLVRKIWQRET